MATIFLAGVHGVGKGYLGTRIAEELGIQHFTASQLIRDEKGRATWRREKIVADIDDNQRALLQAVDRISEPRKTLLLDGHFVLRGANGDLVRLGQEVFGKLRLSGVILLCEKPETVAIRLLQRDGLSVTVDSIAALAAEEERHAREVCASLGIPLKILVSATAALLTEAVRDFSNLSD